MKNSKKIMLASLLLATGYAGLVSAHGLTGSVGLAGSGVARTDIYSVNCPAGNGTTRLFVQVLDKAPVLAPKVSIQARKNGVTSALSTDAIDGDTGYSPGVALSGGEGFYSFSVTKAASTVAGIELYSATYHCQNANGVHTVTNEAVRTQNQ